MQLIFLEPRYIWVLPVLVAACLLWRYLQKPDYIAMTTISWLDPALDRPSLLRLLPLLILLIAAVLIVLALMGPVLPYSEREIESEGLDITIVLDLSASMQELMDQKEPPPGTGTDRRNRTMTMEPAGKTRLDTTKEALRQFINSRSDDRIALVVFSDNAYVVSPLTFDYAYLLQYLDMIDANILQGEGMTAIGDGIALANYLLDRQGSDPPRSQVITVFTDGEHNIGREPVEVLAESDGAGVRIHVVGVDMEEKLKDNEPVKNLIEAVTGHGGRYFDANTESQLFEASREISGMEKVRLVSREYIRHTPVFHWFAIPAGFLILMVFALRTTSYFSDFT
jgi:Ca-activated chloride channel homolog